jgi:hypothetical protein
LKKLINLKKKIVKQLLVEFEIFQILINFKIKNPKKLAFIFRILIKTEFKNSLSFVLENLSKFVQPLKMKKKEVLAGSFLTQDHRGLILLLPYLSCTRAPYGLYSCV